MFLPKIVYGVVAISDAVQRRRFSASHTVVQCNKNLACDDKIMIASISKAAVRLRHIIMPEVYSQ
jgi:hypothetical protein